MSEDNNNKDNEKKDNQEEKKEEEKINNESNNQLKFDENKLILSNEIKFEFEKMNNQQNNNLEVLNNKYNINSLLSQINFEMDLLSNQINTKIPIIDNEKESLNLNKSQMKDSFKKDEEINKSKKFEEIGTQYDEIINNKLNNNINNSNEENKLNINNSISNISNQRKSKSNSINFKDESIQITLSQKYEPKKQNKDYFSSFPYSTQNTNRNINIDKISSRNQYNLNNNFTTRDFPQTKQYGFINTPTHVFNKYSSRIKKMDELYNINFYPRIFKQTSSNNDYNNVNYQPNSFKSLLQDAHKKYSNNIEYKNLYRQRNGNIVQAMNVILNKNKY